MARLLRPGWEAMRPEWVDVVSAGVAGLVVGFGLCRLLRKLLWPEDYWR